MFGWSTTGTLAQYACVPADQLVRKPDRLTMAQAAAVPTSGLTALQALRDIVAPETGERALEEMARVLKPGGEAMFIYPAEPIQGLYAIPTSIIATFAVMYFLGFSLNILTMMGMLR